MKRGHSFMKSLIKGYGSVKRLGTAGLGGSRKGEEMCKMTQDVGSQNSKDRSKCGYNTIIGTFR
jgi:hypothetical protein